MKRGLQVRRARNLIEDASGQMTVELAVIFPVLIIVAVIAINALQFFGICASFDRASHQAIRVYATAPAYGWDSSRCCAQIEQSLKDAFAENEGTTITVSTQAVGVGLQEFTSKIDYLPSIFGMSIQGEIFGVMLPRLTHTTRFVVENYRPGIVI